MIAKSPSRISGIESDLDVDATPLFFGEKSSPSVARCRTFV
jgi:hypothetical protein